MTGITEIGFSVNLHEDCIQGTGEPFDEIVYSEDFCNKCCDLLPG